MKKKLLAMLLAVVMAVGLLPGTAFAADTSGACGTGLTWSYSDGTLSIKGTGPMKDYHVADVLEPDELNQLAPWYDFREEIYTLNIDAGVTSIGNEAFTGCSSLTGVTVPDSVTSIGNGAFFGCSSLTYATLSDSVTIIGEFAFSYCTGLTSINIPSSVTSIEQGVFFGCSGLTSATIGNGVTSIGYGAFEDCSSLANVNIPDSVTSIDQFAFYRCSSLTSVIFGSSVASIGQAAFSDCTNLTSVTIPVSVTNIGWGAFYQCTSLTDVYYGGSQSQWNQISIVEDRNAPLLNATIHYADASGGGGGGGGSTSGTTGSVTVSNPGTANGTVSSNVSTAKKGDTVTVTSKANKGYISNPPTVRDKDGRAVTVTRNADGTYSFTMPEGGVTITGNYVTPGQMFNDVNDGEWYREGIAYAVENGLMQGVGGGQFSPNTPTSRVQILTILARQAGEIIEGADWEQKAINWAVKNGVSDGSDPNEPITREQLIVMLWRYKGKPSADVSVLDSYSDISGIHDWEGFREAMAWAVETGLLKGGGDGKLDPLSNTIRAQAATFLQRYCEDILGK